MAEHKQCGQCQQYSDHFPRRYRGKRFCGACYWYFFIKRECSECHQIKRIHRAEKRPLCYRCYSKVTPCSRCGRVGRPVGKCLETGILCNSCANAFRPDGKCSLCERITTVSLGKKFGLDKPICDTCRTKLHSKCPNCGTRGVLYETAPGVSLCYRCANGITYYCKSCHEPIKGVEKSYCKQCYAIRLNDKRTEVNAASFSTPETEKLFRGFVDWLTNSVGPEKSARTQNHYAEFFNAIQGAPANWQSDVFYLATIDGGFLRTSSKPRLYLESIGVQFDVGALKDAMDLRTINNNLTSIRENCGDEYLAQVDSFFDNRMDEYRNGKTKMLTIRFELSAVLKLLEHVARLGQINEALMAVSITSPGLRCTLGSFINYLNDHQNVLLAFPEPDTEQRLAFLVKQLQSGKVDSSYFGQYVQLCLMLLHNLDTSALKDIQITKDPGGFLVEVEQECYWLPAWPNPNYPG